MMLIKTAALVFAVLYMPDGAPIYAPMPDMESCVIFTRRIAPYVESANCVHSNG